MLDNVADHPTLTHLDIAEDADRLNAASHVEDLILSSAACVLRVIEDGGTWLRVLLADDDRAVWLPA